MKSFKKKYCVYPRQPEGLLKASCINKAIQMVLNSVYGPD